MTGQSAPETWLRSAAPGWPGWTSAFDGAIRREHRCAPTHDLRAAREARLEQEQSQFGARGTARALAVGGQQTALVIAELGHKRLGDILQAITNLRYLKSLLGFERLDINLVDPGEFRFVQELLKEDPFFGRCSNLSYSALRISNYRIVLHYSALKECGITQPDVRAHIEASARQVVFHSIPVDQRTLEEMYGESASRFSCPSWPLRKFRKYVLS